MREAGPCTQKASPGRDHGSQAVTSEQAHPPGHIPEFPKDSRKGMGETHSVWKQKNRRALSAVTHSLVQGLPGRKGWALLARMQQDWSTNTVPTATSHDGSSAILSNTWEPVVQGVPDHKENSLSSKGTYVTNTRTVENYTAVTEPRSR